MKYVMFLWAVGLSFGQAINPAKLVDLTYPFNEKTVYWPNAKGFTHRKDVWAVNEKGFWYAAGGFSADEHGGTHFDAPVHFAKGHPTLDQISVQRLVAPAVVIDISAAVGRNKDYRATPQDVLAFEKKNGAIAPGTMVLFRAGWGKFWPDRKQYLGSDVPGDIDHLHFPGLSREAAELMVQRKVAAVGIDTASMDYGPSQDFIVHQILNKADIFGLENVAHLEKVPPTGATLIALPILIEQGTGGPARIVALLP